MKEITRFRVRFPQCGFTFSWEFTLNGVNKELAVIPAKVKATGNRSG